MTRASGRDSPRDIGDAPRVEMLRAVGAVIEVEVKGSSMLPTLAQGDNVRIRCGQLPSVGSLVGWVAGSRLITHRVVWIDDAGRFMTQGDASWLPDPPQPAHLLLGVVVGVQRDGAWSSVGGDPPHRDGLPKVVGSATATCFRVTSRLSLWAPKLLHAVLFTAARAFERHPR